MTIYTKSARQAVRTMYGGVPLWKMVRFNYNVLRWAVILWHCIRDRLATKDRLRKMESDDDEFVLCNQVQSPIGTYSL